MCLPLQGETLDFVFQLGNRQQPRLDRLLPNVSGYMVFNSISTKLISKEIDGSVIEWDIQTREKRVVANLNVKLLFAYSPRDNRFLIQKSNDDVILRNLVSDDGSDDESDDEILVTKGQFETGSLSVNGRRVVLSKGDNEFVLYQIGHKELNSIKSYQAALPIRNGLTLSNEGNFIAAAEGTYRDGEGHKTQIEVWDSKDKNQPIRVFNTGEILGVWNLIFTQDENLLAVDTQNNAKSGIRVWEVRTGRQLLNKSGFEAYWTRALAFAPKDKVNSIEYLASGDEKGNLRIWKIPEGESVFWDTYPTGIQAIAFSPNGKYLAVALWDATIQILRWNRNE